MDGRGGESDPLYLPIDSVRPVSVEKLHFHPVRIEPWRKRVVAGRGIVHTPHLFCIGLATSSAGPCADDALGHNL